MIMIILSGNYPRHYNAIMLELTDFDDNKISNYMKYYCLILVQVMCNLLKYTIMIDVRRTLENLHQILPDLTLEELFKVLDNIVEVPQFNLGQTTIRRDASNWNPYDSGTFISSASK